MSDHGYVDISALFDSAAVPLIEPLDGLSDRQFTISGIWQNAWPDTSDAVAVLAAKCAPVERLPRKSKKALKKLWHGHTLSRLERARVSRIPFVVE